jgi:hypothetical protein
MKNKDNNNNDNNKKKEKEDFSITYLIVSKDVVEVYFND